MTFVHLDVGNEENEGIAEFFGVTKVPLKHLRLFKCFTTGLEPNVCHIRDGGLLQVPASGGQGKQDNRRKRERLRRRLLCRQVEEVPEVGVPAQGLGRQARQDPCLNKL